MKGSRILSAALAAAMLMSGLGGEAAARAIPHQHIKGHLRVDGSSDLRGQVRARSGLRVTVGITTDSLTSTGPVQLRGILTVTGMTTTGGLNAGGSPITTTGSIQGGTLNATGDASVGGSMAVGRRLTAAGADLGAGGLQVAGGVSGTTASFNGALSAGSLTAASGSFSRLAVAPGGAVNFNNASITGVAGLSLTGNANLSSVRITTGAAGGANGTQALTITQAGSAAALSVASPGILTVSGQGLATPSLTVANNASIGGILSSSHISAPSAVSLDAPTVSATHDLSVGASGNLRLDTGSTHLLGNHDTRGQCAVSVTVPGRVQTCPVSFARAYSSAPIVVVTPAGGDPTMVTSYSVQATASGFTIAFTARSVGSVTFNYMVEG